MTDRQVELDIYDVINRQTDGFILDDSSMTHQ